LVASAAGILLVFSALLAVGISALIAPAFAYDRRQPKFHAATARDLRTAATGCMILVGILVIFPVVYAETGPRPEGWKVVGVIFGVEPVGITLLLFHRRILKWAREFETQSVWNVSLRDPRPPFPCCGLFARKR
jgi:hypothetical protein